MARGLNYEKMKRDDFARSLDVPVKGEQEAKFGVSESGAIKISFRGDQPVDAAIKAISKAIKKSGYTLMSNPVLYFYPVGK